MSKTCLLHKIREFSEYSYLPFINSKSILLEKDALKTVWRKHFLIPTQNVVLAPVIV